MPIYEYFCINCQYEFEELVSKISTYPFPCPKCGNLADRAISKNSFILKGKGWGRDDYSKDAKRPPENVGFTTKIPIIKDRNSGRVLSGPDVPH